MKYVIVKTDLIEGAIICSENINHSDIVPADAEVISAGKFKLETHDESGDIGNLSISIYDHGSENLGMPKNVERLEEDKDVIKMAMKINL